MVLLPALAASLGLSLLLSDLASPAYAQFGDRRGTFDSLFPNYAPPPSPPRSVPSNERPADFSRAPPPRRDQPAANQVLVLGDSMADWLAYGLEDALGDSSDISITRRVRAGSGLIRNDPRELDWVAYAREAIAAAKPKYIVVMIGLNDRQSMRARVAPSSPAQPAVAPAGAAAPPAGAPAAADPGETPSPQTPDAQRGIVETLEFRSDTWAEQYTKRIDALIAVLKAANVPVFWVALPSIRGPKSTSDMQFLDELFRTRAEKAGIAYIDIWDGFVDESGRYTVQGPDFEGQTRRLRVSDGVHFTRAGARKLAHYVERELRRTMTRGITTVSLPATEPQVQTPAARPGQPAERPLSGPVLPLTASVTGQQELVGAGPSNPPVEQPVVRRVLQQGEPVPPPAGRSDDFQWPRREIAPFGKDPLVATTTDPLPVMKPAPAATTVPVPNEELRPVAAAPSGQKRTASRTRESRQQQPQQQQQQRNFGGFFEFFR
jgi:uncharacterized protein